MPKVRYACIDCGALSKWQYPSYFKSRNITEDNYMCHPCKVNTPEVRQHNSEAQIISHNRPEARQRNSEAQKKYYEKLPLEEKQRRSEAQKKSSTPEVKQRQSESHKLSWSQPEVKQRQSETNARPEVRQRRSESAIKRWSNFEERKRGSESAIKRYKDPEERKRGSEMAIKRYKDPEERKQNSNARKIYFENPTNYEQQLIQNSGQGFWYGHPTLHPEKQRKRYCVLWNKYLWVRIDAAWDYKSAYSQKTRWENFNQNQLDRHHVYWQEKACCEWDEDKQGYFAMINNGTKAKPDMVKYYVKGDPNKFVLLTHDEHGMVKGSKKSGKDKMWWVRYFEDLIEKREAEGKSCYLSKEEYKIYKVEHADMITFYTNKQ